LRRETFLLLPYFGSGSPGCGGEEPFMVAEGKSSGSSLRGVLATVIRVIAVPVLPALYVVADALVDLDFMDKLVVVLLTFLSIGLLFPRTRSWVTRFIGRLPGAQDRDRVRRMS
jgi:hypothetical protein